MFYSDDVAIKQEPTDFSDFSEKHKALYIDDYIFKKEIEIGPETLQASKSCLNQNSIADDTSAKTSHNNKTRNSFQHNDLAVPVKMEKDEKLENLHLYKHTISDLKFICDVCDRAFKIKGTLRIHIRSHMNKRNRQNHIDSKSSLKRSTIIISKKSSTTHSAYLETDRGKVQYQCDVCKKAFKTKSTFRKHKNKHIDSKQYRCLKCFKSFHYTSSLHSHMFTHATKLQYQCHLCGKSYKSKDSLRKHFNIKHLNKKPNKCTKCLKSFYDITTLRRHFYKTCK